MQSRRASNLCDAGRPPIAVAVAQKPDVLHGTDDARAPALLHDGCHSIDGCPDVALADLPVRDCPDRPWAKLNHADMLLLETNQKLVLGQV